MINAAIDLRAKPSWRSTKSRAMSVAMALAVVAILVPLVAVIYAVISRGVGAAFDGFPAFFTEDIPALSRRAGPGMGPAILGTLLATATATLIAVPLGVLGAVYLHEYGGGGAFARTVRFMAMVMTGVPSIVMGLFVYLVWTMRWKQQSAFGGALALACLMLPVVIGSTEQMLRLVPTALREASYALGASKSRTILTVVLPAALPGIVSGALLAVARAAGETAPLLFTVGAAKSFVPHLFGEANTALSLQIFSSDLAFPAAEGRAWGAAFTLVALTFLLTFVARVFTARFALKR